jgi:histidinol-phosphate aminotransferase
VFGSPTFDGYPIMAGIAEVSAAQIPLDDNGCQDLRAMAAAIDDDTGLVVVCRPHNPTGTLVSAAELDDFLRTVPRHVVVILDEAYVEFVADPDVVDARRLVAKYPNLMVLRTFSKAFGLAGLRIGYAFGAPDLAARVRRWQLPFGVNATAVAAVSASYAAEHELADRVDRITRERDALRNALVRSGIAVPVRHANFLYLPGPHVAESLRQAGIAAKYYPDGSAPSPSAIRSRAAPSSKRCWPTTFTPSRHSSVPTRFADPPSGGAPDDPAGMTEPTIPAGGRAGRRGGRCTRWSPGKPWSPCPASPVRRSPC